MHPFYFGSDLHLKRTNIVLINDNLDVILQDFIKAESMKLNKKLIVLGQKFTE